MKQTIVFLGIFSLLSLGACTPKVDYQTWCNATMTTICSHCSPMEMPTCLQSGVQACMSNHQPLDKTQRTAEELASCQAALMTADCTALGAGTIPPVCSGK